nr:sulfate permease [Cryptomonas curvata]
MVPKFLNLEGNKILEAYAINEENIKNNLDIKFSKSDLLDKLNQKNLIKIIVEKSQTKNARKLCTNFLAETWSSYNFEFQKEFSNIQEIFLKNAKVLSTRYELYHLCLAELIYTNKKKKKDEFVHLLTKISITHENLFKTGLISLPDVFSFNRNYFTSNATTNSEKNQIESSELLGRKKFYNRNLVLKKFKKFKVNNQSIWSILTWSLYRFFPIITWFPQYKIRKHLKHDLVAGITVGVMLIAQGMAYAKLAGLSPEYGLYSSGLPLLIYPLFGTSRHLGIGPVALVSLLVSQVTLSTNSAGHDYSNHEKTCFALLIAFCVGIVQIFMGLIQIGFIINFISHPVIAGFTTAAAFVIILSQLQYILGYSVHRSHYPFMSLYNYFIFFQKFKWQPFLFGLINILFMQLIRLINQKFKMEIPGPIFCVFISILIAYTFKLNQFGISIQNNIPKGFPKIRGPVFNEFTKVAPTVLTISFINFLETIAISSKIGEIYGYKIVPDQELLGSGMTNLLGSFVSAFPMAGSFSRTAVLSQAGAKTQVAGIVTGMVIILTYLYLTPLFTFLPNVTLASIILVSVVNLIDYNEAVHLFRIRFLDFFAFMISLISTFMVGVEWGIVIAVIVSLVFVLWFSVKPPTCVLGRVPGTVVYRDVKWYYGCIKTPGGILLRMDAPLFFVNAAVLRKKIRQKEEEYENQNPVPIFYIILDCRGMTDIDSTGLQILSELGEKYNKQGVFLGFANVNDRVRKLMKSANLDNLIENTRYFSRIHDGVEAAIRWKNHHLKISKKLDISIIG